jgi:hypothetical protein
MGVAVVLRALRQSGAPSAFWCLQLFACVHDSVGAEPPFMLQASPGSAVESSLATHAQAAAPSPSSAAPAAPVLPVPQRAASAGAEPPGPVAPVDPVVADCDLSGSWIAQHVTRNSALGAVQSATNWHFHRIEQTADRFRVTESVDCGFAVRGTTDVSISDATLEAVATRSRNATGVGGTFQLGADAQSCELSFERAYTIRGADRARFLDAVWSVGDPPKDLNEFTLPTSAADGMEDWDSDGHEGVTQTTGFGERYSAQLDWYSVHGRVPLRANEFGGEGVLAVDYDARESIAAETPALLQTMGTPMSPGYARMVRIDGELAAADAASKLELCKQVQAMAVAKFGDPPRP